jgi:hypothetical protein
MCSMGLKPYENLNKFFTTTKKSLRIGVTVAGLRSIFDGREGVVSSSQYKGEGR